MREIKFRGHYHKDKDVLYPREHKWVYGYLVGGEWGGYWIKEGKHSYYVDRKSVGQYTGLKDRHGKEIYGGDILSEGFGALQGPVSFNEKMARFEYTTKTDSIGLYGFCGEIIGNIYENPELLESRG